MACAGGVERSSQSVGILFEEGSYVELTYGSVDPTVSGIQQSDVNVFGPRGSIGAGTGDISPSYNTVALAYKTQLTDKIDMALILDEPIGADVNYADPAYAYGGSTASISSHAITALLKYNLPNNFSVYGGLRHQRAKGEVDLFLGYTMQTDTAQDWGWVAGVAWEKPEIAARVALTYHSEITHTFNASETFIAPRPASTFDTTVPQSLNLEFQTGIAPDTLLFGSIRWVDWTAFDISPDFYGVITSGGSLVDYQNDTITYNLGIGRRFNEKWSGAVQIGYEPSNGGFSGNLGPTDGFTSLGVAASYKHNNMTVTAGVRHIWIGDAVTENPSPGATPGTTLGDFDDNTGWAWGLQVGYQF